MAEVIGLEELSKNLVDSSDSSGDQEDARQALSQALELLRRQEPDYIEKIVSELTEDTKIPDERRLPKFTPVFDAEKHVVGMDISPNMDDRYGSEQSWALSLDPRSDYTDPDAPGGGRQVVFVQHWGNPSWNFQPY